MTKSDLARILRIVGEENRLEMLCLLFKFEKLCVSDIASKLELSMATASHHLNVLESAGVLYNLREGKEMFYSPTRADVVQDLKELICSNTKLKLNNY